MCKGVWAVRRAVVRWCARERLGAREVDEVQLACEQQREHRGVNRGVYTCGHGCVQGCGQGRGVDEARRAAALLLPRLRAIDVERHHGMRAGRARLEDSARLEMSEPSMRRMRGEA